MLLCILDDMHHHLKCFKRIFSLSRLTREHHCIRSVINRIRNICHFRTRRAGIADHGIKHLCRRDNSLKIIITFLDHHLLQIRHFLCRNLNSQISPRNHNTVCSADNLINVADSLCILNLRNNRSIRGPKLFQKRFNLKNTLCISHKRSRDKVDTLLYSESDIVLVFLRDRGEPHCHVRDIDSLLFTKLSAVFNANFTGITEDKITSLTIRAAERAVDDTMGLTGVIASFAIEILSDSKSGEAYVTGANRLLAQPEFQDPAKAHALMSYISDAEHIRNLPDVYDVGGEGIKVLIGPENVAEELKDSSVVLASYDMGDNTKGLIGVVGPTRMDYSTVAAKLGLIAKALSERLGGGIAPPKGLDNKLIIKEDTNEQQEE